MAVPVIDEFFDFLERAYGLTPDKLKPYERQAVAVLAVATVNRFAPFITQGQVINAITRASFLYVARHPFATIAAFWFGAWRGSRYREQELGPFTRELETAALVPIFGQAPSVLRATGTAAWAIFRWPIGSIINSLLRIPASIPLPSVPPNWIVNRYTTAAARFVGRHPAALLGAYFVSQYIEATYRQQYLGRYSQEIVTAALYPAFALAPQAIPYAIEGAGWAINQGARGVAATSRRALALVGPQSAASNAALVNSRWGPPAAGVSLGVIAEYFQYRERRAALSANRDPAWWAMYPGTGFATVAAVTGLSYVPPERWMSLGGFLRANTSPSALRIYGQGFLSGATWLADVKYFWAFPRTARFLIRASWVATGVLKLSLPLSYIPGFADSLEYVNRPLAWVAGVGFVAPFFLTGTLRGAGAELGSWVNSVLVILRNPIAFVKHELQAITAITRLNRLAPYIPQVQASLQRGAAGLRTGATYLGRGVGTVARAAASAPVQFAAAPLEFADIVGTAWELSNVEGDLIDRTRGLLWTMRQQESRGYRFPVSARELESQIFATYEQRPDRGRIPFWQRQINFLQARSETARRELLTRDVGSLGETIAGVASVAALAVEGIAQQAQTFADRLNANAAQSPTAARDAWRNQPRDALGRFARQTFGFNTGEPMPGVGFDEALAYINRLAQAAEMPKIQTASVGVQHAGVFALGSGSGEAVGRGREFWLYRSRDRRLLLQTLRDVLEIIDRDKLAASGKTTTKLSNRSPIFSQQFPGIEAAVIQILRAMEYDVGLVRDRGAVNQYHFIGDERLNEYLSGMWPKLITEAS